VASRHSRYRFRVLDSEGQDLKERPTTINDESADLGSRNSLIDAKPDRKCVSMPFNPYDNNRAHSTRVEWGKRDPMVDQFAAHGGGG